MKKDNKDNKNNLIMKNTTIQNIQKKVKWMKVLCKIG